MFHLFCTWITNSSTRRIEIRNNTKSGLKIWSSSWTYTTGSNPSTVKSSQVSSNLFVSLARPSRYIRERCILFRKMFEGKSKKGWRNVNMGCPAAPTVRVLPLSKWVDEQVWIARPTEKRNIFSLCWDPGCFLLGDLLTLHNTYQTLLFIIINAIYHLEP